MTGSKNHRKRIQRTKRLSEKIGRRPWSKK